MDAKRTTAALVLAVTALASASACSSSSPAGSAAASAASAAASAAVSAAQSAGQSALASASAAVSSALASAAAGLDVKKDVTVSEPAAASGGKVSSTVKVTNSSGSQASFLVTVSFRDSSGNILDVDVVTVENVRAGGTGTATATSHRSLTGTVKAQVDAAVRT
ncbi:hypothetical protein [Streptacidiphilus jiangxiensis]|uniref:Uncharacterized protein n=1 Tax=Streptacidiphilus jiangxiensis TaxID=235985 RepID=A0A1H7U6L1_STRJI|nr:hypothetical protein [Streptacidiphilus jiangxiensis]SEL92308.1 hypothetical protein SAMN05414137_11595 [Streptacidiphilus jiangxiensis]